MRRMNLRKEKVLQIVSGLFDKADAAEWEQPRKQNGDLFKSNE